MGIDELTFDELDTLLMPIEIDYAFLNDSINYFERMMSSWGSSYDTRRQLTGYRRGLALSKAKLNGTHTKEQWLIILKIFNGTCSNCGCKTIGNPTKDHIIPISIGGSDGIWNLQPLCRECNSLKLSYAVDYRPSWLIDLLSEVGHG